MDSTDDDDDDVNEDNEITSFTDDDLTIYNDWGLPDDWDSTDDDEEVTECNDILGVADDGGPCNSIELHISELSRMDYVMVSSAPDHFFGRHRAFSACCLALFAKVSRWRCCMLTQLHGET
jgi:hypothetical protein